MLRLFLTGKYLKTGRSRNASITAVPYRKEDAYDLLVEMDDFEFRQKIRSETAKLLAQLLEAVESDQTYFNSN